MAIKITGPDLRRLRELGDEVEHLIEDIPGIRDLAVEPLVLLEQVEVRPERERLARAGVPVSRVARTVALALGGETVGEMPAGRISYPIKVQLRPEDRREPADWRVCC